MLRIEELRRQSQALARQKAATIDMGSYAPPAAENSTGPESPRWDCTAKLSTRSSRSASCDSVTVSNKAPLRRRCETATEAAEALGARRTTQWRRSKYLTATNSLSPRRMAATAYDSPQYSRSICANTSGSKLSDGDRTLLLHVADKNSRALARRACRMLDVMYERQRLRSATRLGTLLSDAVPTHIDGYTLIENEYGTKIFQLDVGRQSRETRRSSKEKSPDRLRFLGFRKVRGTIAELTELLGSKSDEAAALMNPDMTEVRRLHALMNTPEERPECPEIDGDGRYVGLSWMAMQTPSWLGWKSAKLRDFLLLEDQSSFRAPDGRYGWVQSLHSVQLPWCPSQEYTNCVVRGSMYQSGIIAVPAKEAPDRWLDVMCAVEVDLKGNISEKSHRAMAFKRLSCLASLDRALVDRRLQRISFMDTSRFELTRPEAQRQCHVCSSKFRVFGKAFACRKCGETVCKRCSVELRIATSAAELKKRRVCTRCVLKRAAPEPVFSPPCPPASAPRSSSHRQPPPQPRRASHTADKAKDDERVFRLLRHGLAPPAPDQRTARASTLPLAPISEERQSLLLRQPTPPSSASRQPAPPLGCRRPQEPQKGRGAASEAERRRARRSKWKNERLAARRAALGGAAMPADAEVDATPPSQRGSSLHVHMVNDEIML